MYYGQCEGTPHPPTHPPLPALRTSIEHDAHLVDSPPMFATLVCACMRAQRCLYERDRVWRAVFVADPLELLLLPRSLRFEGRQLLGGWLHLQLRLWEEGEGKRGESTGE